MAFIGMFWYGVSLFLLKKTKKLYITEGAIYVLLLFAFSLGGNTILESRKMHWPTEYYPRPISSKDKIHILQFYPCLLLCRKHFLGGIGGKSGGFRYGFIAEITNFGMPTATTILINLPKGETPRPHHHATGPRTLTLTTKTIPDMISRKLFAIVILATSAIAAMAQTQQIRAFSHRGGRMEHDENTLSAFQASHDAGYTGYETDLRMTADGHLVVTHDSNLERTTNGTGAVEKLTRKQIEQLRTKKGHKLMFIDELMAWLKDKKGLYVEFEMKTNPVDLYPEERLPEYVDALYNAVMASRPADAEFVFTSGDYRSLRCMQARHPDADLLMITGKPCCAETIALCKALGIKRIGATMNGTSREAVALAHKEGLIVSLWPGQSTADFMLGAYLGCDFMCTDIPIELKSWVEANAPWLKVTY